MVDSRLALKVYKELEHEPENRMSEAQRKCLLHVLRNLTTGLVGAICLLEDEMDSPSRDTLLGCLKNIPHSVDRVVKALEAGTFCTLSPEECLFVGPHMGCKASDCLAKKTQSRTTKS